MPQLSMGFEYDSFPRVRWKKGFSRREEREIIAEGTANEFRHDCVIAEKGGFAGRRHTSIDRSWPVLLLSDVKFRSLARTRHGSPALDRTNLSQEQDLPMRDRRCSDG